MIEQLFAVHSTRPPRGPVARFFGVRPLGDDATPWYIGARGELAVGRILDQLPQGWTVLHSLPVGTKESDIDHLVIGPAGVFVINTKHHASKTIWVAGSTVMVGGFKHPYIRNSEHEAKAVGKVLASVGLDHSVIPILAFVDPTQITVKEKPASVAVLHARGLLKFFARRPQTLTADEVTQTVAVLGDPQRWRSSAEAPAGLLDDFHALDREIRTARTIRVAWAGALLASLGGTSIVLAPQLMSSLFSLLIH
ncbi:nuclease-related domain-containing protein [Naasia lichenicola]|uniref:nuclease-related domain-containing protein n=1 Tax=Naasia lichenicola TaxID=2565933 RepID=UPI00130E73CB|nr:nuclease-related domain-containing protein [Naasia lichenicola]